MQTIKMTQEEFERLPDRTNMSPLYPDQILGSAWKYCASGQWYYGYTYDPGEPGTIGVGFKPIEILFFDPESPQNAKKSSETTENWWFLLEDLEWGYQRYA